MAQDETAQDSASGGWRISTTNGMLLACYFIPAWTLVAFKIMVSPVHGLFDRPNVAVAIFLSDHFQFAAMNSVRVAWLLALAKLTTVAFLAVFLVFATRPSIRKSGGCDEALWLALLIGGVISSASMIMASKVGELAALRLHATELLMMLGAAIVMAIDAPSQPAPVPVRQGERAPAYRLSNPSS